MRRLPKGTDRKLSSNTWAPEEVRSLTIAGVLWASALAVLIVTDPNAAGWVTLLALVFVVCAIADRSPVVRERLYVGLALTAVLIVAGVYWVVLPESTSDAARFEMNEWEIAQAG